MSISHAHPGHCLRWQAAVMRLLLAVALIVLTGNVAACTSPISDDDVEATATPSPTTPPAKTATFLPPMVPVLYLVTTSQPGQRVALQYRDDAGVWNDLEITTDSMGHWQWEATMEQGTPVEVDAKNLSAAGEIECQIRVGNEFAYGDIAQPGTAHDLALCAGVAVSRAGT